MNPQQPCGAGDPRLAARRAPAAARLLIVGQVALSLTLLVSALLFAMTMSNLRRVDLGFTAGRVLTQSLDPMMNGGATPSGAGNSGRASSTGAGAAGRPPASLSVLTPLSGRNTGELLSGPGVANRQMVDRVVRVNHVSEDYLTVFGIRLVQGRPLTDADRTAHVALVTKRRRRTCSRAGARWARRSTSAKAVAIRSSAW